MKFIKYFIVSAFFFTGSFTAKAQDQAAADKIPTAQESRDFLMKNTSNLGILTTPSGLQYKIMKNGTGPKALGTDRVTLYYSISYINGTKIFKPRDVNTPWIHHVDKALPGMQEAIQLMNVGSKWVLYMPASLAFGESGYENIPGGAAIVCEIELVAATHD